MDSELDELFSFFREIDKEKKIGRQTYLADGERKENDAEHAWHMAVMALLLKEYANEDVDIVKVILMILMHDVVEIDAGDTYAYDEDGKKTQREREEKAADRIYGLLKSEKGSYLRGLWEEFEERKTPEAKFARCLDNVQPLMLNAASDCKAWEEHNTKVSQVMERNKITKDGSETLWEYAFENFIKKGIRSGKLINDMNIEV